MMKAVAATICVWWCIMMMVVMPSLAVEAADDECGQQLGYFGSVGFEVQKGMSNIRCYSKFLRRLRQRVEAPGVRICGLPTTQNIPINSPEYVTVDLKISNTEWVSLGVDARDLYVLGYQDKFNGQLRSNFLKDTKQHARTHLFPNAVTTRTTNFGGSYPSLEGYAKIDKKEQTLSMYRLERSIKDVYGKPPRELNNQAEAEFFLRVIQMVAEAARFKFIENAIVAGDNSPDTKLKLAGYLNDWSKISKAIYKANSAPINKCTTFEDTLAVGNLEYKAYFTQVNDIKYEMALLLYSDITVSTPLKYDFNLHRRPFLKSAVVM